MAAGSHNRFSLLHDILLCEYTTVQLPLPLQVDMGLFPVFGN